MDKYAVSGNPINHCKSPEIHHMFAQQAEDEIMYETLLSPIDEFEETVEAFRKGGGMGLNVTVPSNKKHGSWQMSLVTMQNVQAR